MQRNNNERVNHGLGADIFKLRDLGYWRCDFLCWTVFNHHDSSYADYICSRYSLEFFRLFLPFLPDFWETIGSSSSSLSKGFDWGERTEADKHRDLVEHIRIQHMNEERNRR